MLIWVSIVFLLEMLRNLELDEVLSGVGNSEHMRLFK